MAFFSGRLFSEHICPAINKPLETLMLLGRKVRVCYNNSLKDCPTDSVHVPSIQNIWISSQQNAPTVITVTKLP